MDDEGKVLAVQGDRSVAGFEKTLKTKVQQFVDLRAKAKAGDPAAQIEFTLLEGDLARITLEEVNKRLQGKQLTDAQKAMLVDIELGEMMGELNNATSEAEARVTMKKVADAYAAGRSPTGSEKRLQFFGVVLTYAMAEENADLAQKALDAVKPIYEETYGKDNPKLQQWLKTMSEKIAEMRSAAKEGCGDDEGMEEGCGEKEGD